MQAQRSQKQVRHNMGRRPLPKKLWMSLSGYLLSILLAFTASAAAAGLIPGSNGGFRCGAQRTDCLVLVCVHTAHDVRNAWVPSI